MDTPVKYWRAKIYLASLLVLGAMHDAAEAATINLRFEAASNPAAGHCGFFLLTPTNDHQWTVTVYYTIVGTNIHGQPESYSGELPGHAGPLTAKFPVSGMGVDCRKTFTITHSSWKGYDQTEANALAERKRHAEGTNEIERLLRRDLQDRQARERAEAVRLQTLRNAQLAKEAERKQREQAANDFRQQQERAKRESELSRLRAHPECLVLTIQELNQCLGKRRAESEAAAGAANAQRQAESARAKAEAMWASQQNALMAEIEASPTCSFTARPQTIPYPTTDAGRQLPANEIAFIDAQNAALARQFSGDANMLVNQCKMRRSNTVAAAAAGTPALHASQESRRIEQQRLAEVQRSAEATQRAERIQTAHADWDAAIASGQSNLRESQERNMKMGTSNASLKDLVDGLK